MSKKKATSKKSTTVKSKIKRKSVSVLMESSGEIALSNAIVEQIDFNRQFGYELEDIKFDTLQLRNKNGEFTNVHITVFIIFIKEV